MSEVPTSTRTAKGAAEGPSEDPAAAISDKMRAKIESKDPEASGYSQAAESKRNQDAEKSDYHYNQAAEKLAAEEKKSGCLPKLFMLLVPFVALGTYVLLKS